MLNQFLVVVRIVYYSLYIHYCELCTIHYTVY